MAIIVPRLNPDEIRTVVWTRHRLVHVYGYAIHCNVQGYMGTDHAGQHGFGVIAHINGQQIVHFFPVSPSSLTSRERTCVAKALDLVSQISPYEGHTTLEKAWVAAQ